MRMQRGRKRRKEAVPTRETGKSQAKWRQHQQPERQTAVAGVVIRLARQEAVPEIACLRINEFHSTRQRFWHRFSPLSVWLGPSKMK
jgi:hypothetical protein